MLINNKLLTMYTKQMIDQLIISMKLDCFLMSHTQITYNNKINFDCKEDLNSVK
jgi:hypothetical protein